LLDLWRVNAAMEATLAGRAAEGPVAQVLRALQGGTLDAGPDSALTIVALFVLIAAEHRAATLAAEGHSNREIAQQLCVTQRTVETHLTHAFQKLHITNRAQFPAHLDQRPRAEQLVAAVAAAQQAAAEHARAALGE
jgi:DNA-binding CsgD family transcriptional regulator